MNTLEITTRIRNILDELNISNSHYSDDGSDNKPSIRRIINEAVADAVRRLPAPLLPALFDDDIKSLQIGLALYDMPSGWCRTMELYLYGERAIIFPISHEYALTNNSIFVPLKTEPYAIMPYKDNKFKIFPTPDTMIAGTGGLYHFFLRMAAEVSGDSDVPEIPHQFHQALVDYGVYRALLEADDQRANGMFKVYEAHFGGTK